MSAQINCDRCGADTALHFGDVNLEVQRGHYGNTDSKLHPGILWLKRWHLCETCIASLKDWASAESTERKA